MLKKIFFISATFVFAMVAATGCSPSNNINGQLFDTILTPKTPENASLVDDVTYANAMVEAINNISRLTDYKAQFNSGSTNTDDPDLPANYLANDGNVVIDQTLEATIYANDIFVQRANARQEHNTNHSNTYVITASNDTITYISETEEFNESTEEYENKFAIYTNCDYDSGQGVINKYTDTEISGVSTLAEAELEFNQLIEETVFDLIGIFGISIYPDIDDFDGTVLMADKSIYCTFYNVTTVLEDNPRYPDDLEKQILFFNGSGYQLRFDYLDSNIGYVLAKVDIYSNKYRSTDLENQPLNSPFIKNQQHVSYKFNYGERVLYKGETPTPIFDEFSKYRVSLAIFSSLSSSTPNTTNLNNITETYKTIYDANYSGAVYYCTYNVSSIAYLKIEITNLETSNATYYGFSSLVKTSDLYYDRIGCASSDDIDDVIQLAAGTYYIEVFLESVGDAPSIKIGALY